MQIPFEIVNKRWGIIFLFIVENGHWFFLLLVLKAHCISEQKVLHNSTQQISINFWSLLVCGYLNFCPATHLRGQRLLTLHFADFASRHAALLYIVNM